MFVWGDGILGFSEAMGILYEGCDGDGWAGARAGDGMVEPRFCPTWKYGYLKH